MNEPVVLEDIAGQAMFVKDAMGWRESGEWPSKHWECNVEV